MNSAFVLATTPTPSSTVTSTGTSTTSTSEVDSDLVTPGLWGFVLLFFMAVAVFLLGRSMARRVQRVNHRARAEEEAREEAEAAAAQRQDH